MQIVKTKKSLIRENKAKIVKTIAGETTNTGSTEVQIALITDRINGLTPHFKAFPKDFASRRGLLKMVGQRRRLLNYLKATNENSYQNLIQKLELRK